MATVREHTETIDGINYTTTTLSASEGLRIMPKVVSLVGQTLMSLFFAADEDKRLAMLSNPKIVGGIINQIATNAAEDDGLLVVKDLLKKTKCDQVAIGDARVPGSVYDHFDIHFAARYKHLAEVAMWVGRVNFLAP